MRFKRRCRGGSSPEQLDSSRSQIIKGEITMDYTVIVQVRHQFGNEDIDVGVFAGEQFDFSFDCPKVESGQVAILLFQGFRVGEEQTLEINGTEVPGGIPAGPLSGGLTSFAGSDHHAHSYFSPPFGWSAYSMLVGPGVLRETGNVMHVASRDGAEFVIDNVVLFFKTRSGRIPPVLDPVFNQ
jgi:hypothetical protein